MFLNWQILHSSLKLIINYLTIIQVNWSTVYLFGPINIESLKYFKKSYLIKRDFFNKFSFGVIFNFFKQIHFLKSLLEFRCYYEIKPCYLLQNSENV